MFLSNFRSIEAPKSLAKKKHFVSCDIDSLECVQRPRIYIAAFNIDIKFSEIFTANHFRKVRDSLHICQRFCQLVSIEFVLPAYNESLDVEAWRTIAG